MGIIVHSCSNDEVTHEVIQEQDPTKIEEYHIYGPNENEWTIRNRTQLQNLLPSGVVLLEQTVNKIMQVPSAEILTKLSTY